MIRWYFLQYSLWISCLQYCKALIHLTILHIPHPQTYISAWVIITPHAFLTYCWKETIVAAFPVLRVPLMCYIFKQMTHYMHSGLSMKTVVPFRTITVHVCQPQAYAQICFHTVFWSEWLSGSSLFIRGWQSYFIENGKVTANWFYSDTDGETMNVPSIQSAI